MSGQENRETRDPSVSPLREQKLLVKHIYGDKWAHFQLTRISQEYLNESPFTTELLRQNYGNRILKLQPVLMQFI